MGEQHAAGADHARDAAVYVVAYVEVMPPSTGDAATLLRQYREASRNDEGQERLEVLQQRGRPDHFACVQIWQHQKALEAHGEAVHTRRLRDQLQPLCVSPYDARLHHGLALGSPLAAPAPRAIYVLTHADAIPPGKDEAMVLLAQLAEASRKEGGVGRFEVLQQISRQNHFTLVEVWQDQMAVEAHAMAAHTRHFRERFQPFSGALYDERLYQALD